MEEPQEGIMESSDKRERLKEFYLNIRNCDKCDLSKTRTKFVFGSGSAEARIMFVGEAPGKNEDLQGLPFVGQAGKLFDELLGSIGYDRSEVFIANVLKCRPPGNRDPRMEEIDSCKDYLMEQIKIIDPKIICTMGRFSTQLMLDTNKGINGLRGKIFRIGNHIIMPINHPAAALYAPSKMSVLKEDFQKIKRLIDSDGEIPDSEEGVSYLESGTLDDKQEKGEQLGLF
jgi:uracil-DNA glycosylase family 4